MKAWLAIALAWCGAAHAFNGVFTRVSDGDTLWVRLDPATQAERARPIKLRLQGLDAPERCQPGGPQAQAALESRVLHRRVQVTTRATDDYGRRIGQLWLHGEDVGTWMVLHGHAWSQRYRRSAGPYAAQEQQARAARRGVFAPGDALEPWVFRQRYGVCR